MMNQTPQIGILEDDAELASYLSEIIRSQGWGVRFCEPVLENALRAIEDDEPDLLIVDLNVPDGSGISLIERGHAPGIKSLVYTVFGDEQNVMKAVAAGASGYLLKDSRIEDVVHHVEAALDGDAPFSPSVAKFLLAALRPNENSIKQGYTPSVKVCLTPKERAVLNMFSKGLSYRETGEALGITRHTVSDHVKSIYKKLGVHSKTEALFEAGLLGLLN